MSAPAKHKIGLKVAEFGEIEFTGSSQRAVVAAASRAAAMIAVSSTCMALRYND
jgi:hypothetical protein